MNGPHQSGPDRRWYRSLSAGETLIGLGALALVAAGFAFLRSVWSDLGTIGQMSVLLAVVLAQAAVSVAAMPRIRVLGESLAGASAATLLLALWWGYERLGVPEELFSLLVYGLAFVQTAAFCLPARVRAQAWQYTVSVYCLVAAFGLSATGAPHLFALGGVALGLAVSRVAFKEAAERFAALHAVLALFHAVVYGFGNGVQHLLVAMISVITLSASTLLTTSMSSGRADVTRQWPLRGIVWAASFAAFSMAGVHGVLDAGPAFRDRLMFALAGGCFAALVQRFQPAGVGKYRKYLTAGAAMVSILQLVRESVLVPSYEFLLDLLDAIGLGYLLLGAGLLLLVGSIRWRWTAPAFTGAVVASMGWYGLYAVGTSRLSDALESAPLPEALSVPVAGALIAAGFAGYEPRESSSRRFLPGMLMLLVPTTLATLRESLAGLRFSLLVVLCVICLVSGFRLRIHALVVPPGSSLLVVLLYRAFGLLGDSWVTLALAALGLLVIGSLFEKMRDRVRAARTYITNLR